MKNKILPSFLIIATLAVAFFSQQYLTTVEQNQKIADRLSLPPELELKFNANLTGSLNNNSCPLPGSAVTQENIDQFANRANSRENMTDRNIVGKKTMTFHSATEQSIKDKINLIEPKLNNKVFFAYYRNQAPLPEDQYTRSGFYVYPALPENFVNSNNNDAANTKIYNIENPENFFIPANEGLTMLSCSNTKIYDHKNAQEYGGAVSEKITSRANSGWILTAIPETLFAENSDLLSNILNSALIESVFPFKTNDGLFPTLVDSLTNAFKAKNLGSLRVNTNTYKLLWIYKDAAEEPIPANPEPEPEPELEPNQEIPSNSITPGNGGNINQNDQFDQETNGRLNHFGNLINEAQEAQSEEERTQAFQDLIAVVQNEEEMNQLRETVSDFQNIISPSDAADLLSQASEAVQAQREANLAAELAAAKTVRDTKKTEIDELQNNIGTLMTRFIFLSDIEKNQIIDEVNILTGHRNQLFEEYETLHNNVLELDENASDPFNQIDQCVNANDTGKTQNTLSKVCVNKIENNISIFKIETCHIGKENHVIGNFTLDLNNEENIIGNVLYVCKQNRWIQINPEQGPNMNLFEEEAKRSFDTIFRLLDEIIQGTNETISYVENRDSNNSDATFNVSILLNRNIQDLGDKIQIIKQKADKLFDNLQMSYNIFDLNVRNFKNDFQSAIILPSGNSNRTSSKRSLRNTNTLYISNSTLLDALETIFYSKTEENKPIRIIRAAR